MFYFLRQDLFRPLGMIEIYAVNLEGSEYRLRFGKL
jgi:hypothetical protein